MSWGTWCCCFLCTLTVNVVLATDTSCPTWHYYNNITGVCECGFGLICSCDGNQVEIMNGYCATSSGKEGDYYRGTCPFRHTFNNTNRMYSEMPSNASQLDEVMCGPYNRKGLLCGECKDGYGPAVYSHDLKCANCSSLWSKYAILLYLFIQFVPSTLIFICLFVFRLNITSGPLLGYILFCQTILVHLGDRKYLFDYTQSDDIVSPNFEKLFSFLKIFSEFWSLKFLAIIPPFCISDKLTGIHVVMLDITSATYPLFLVMISCILTELYARNYRIVVILWKPFKIILRKANITAVTGDAVFHAFASLIFLSNILVIYATIQVLQTSSISNSTKIYYRKVLLCDTTIEWLSHKCIRYVLIVLIPFFSISVIPSVLLCIYPTRVYRYLSRFLSARKRLAITAFAEALHSCFKDGLNGTRDYRALAGGPVVICILILIGDNVVHPSTLMAVILTALFCVVSYMKPCKSAISNISLVFHMILFGGFWFTTHLWRHDLSVKTYTLELALIAILLTPHILVALWAGYTLTKYTLTRCGYQFHGPGYKMALSDMANGVRLCLYRRHRGYQELQ